MTITQNETTTTELAVGDIVAVIDTDGDSLSAVENSIGIVEDIVFGPDGSEPLLTVRQSNGEVTGMYAFRFHKLAVGDRVRVTYSKNWDGEGVVTAISEKLQIIFVEMATGEMKGVKGGFHPESLTFIEAAPEGKQPIPHGTHSDYGQNVYGFALGDKALAAGRSAKRLIGQAVEIVELGDDLGWVWVEGVDGDRVDVWLSHLEPLPEPEPKLPYAVGDRVVYVGNSEGEYFEPEAVGATGTVSQQREDGSTSVVWDYDTTRRPAANVFTNNLALAGELVATAEEELDAIPTVADLEGFAAINSEGTVLRSVETGYVYGKQGGRWLQLGSTGDASWTVVKAIEVGKHMQVLSA